MAWTTKEANLSDKDPSQRECSWILGIRIIVSGLCHSAITAQGDGPLREDLPLLLAIFFLQKIFEFFDFSVKDKKIDNQASQYDENNTDHNVNFAF